MYKVCISYSVALTYATLADAERALEVLFQGGATKVEIRFVPLEEAVEEQEAE